MYRLCNICLLQQTIEEQESLLPRIVGFGGIIIIVLAIAFLLFFLLARYKQNTLFMRQKALQEEFQKQLMQVQIEVQEHTSAELGRELHDNIGQLLSSTKMLLGVAERQMPEPPPAIHSAYDTLSHAIQELRSLSKALNKEWLSQFDLMANLRTEQYRINSNDGTKVSLTSSVDEIPLTAEEGIMVFRIVQEAMQNAIKHAEAQHIEITISGKPNSFFVNICDDGKGFDTEAAQRNGIGLKNMRHRTKLLKGSISWQPNKPRGTKVQIELPVKT